MLNKAQNLLNKQMKDREALAEKCYATIKDAQEALKALGYEAVESLEEVIPVITINKGKVVEVQVTNEEEIEQLKREVLSYKGQIAGYEAQLTNKDILIDKLEKEIQDAKEEKVRAEISATKKGGDAVKAQPEQPKKKDLLSKIKRAPQFTLDEAYENQVKKLEEQAKEKEERKAQMPKYSLDYKPITFDKSMKTRTMFGIHGFVTIEDKKYAFKATNNHHMPIVYGCFDMDAINFTKEIITNDVDKFNFISDDKCVANYSHINDTEGRLVVWRLTDENGKVSFHGYSDNYIIVWEPAKYDIPMRKLMKYALDKNPKHFRKIEQQKNAKKLSDKFMAVCKNIWPENFTNDDNDPEPTKAVKHITKEQPSTTKETVKITKEQHQQTQGVVFTGTIDNIGKPMNNTNDDFDAADADDIDL